MSEPESLNGSAFGNGGVKCQVVEWPVKRTNAEPHIYSAYNRTRERLLCSHIELADLRQESLPELIASLTPGCKSGLWLAPFLGISPDHVTSPLDLVYLDHNNRVVALVESFPISQAAFTNFPPGTVLALPAQAIASRGIFVGDQLILCSPRKMKTRLDSLKADSAHVQRGNDHSYFPFSIAHSFPPVPGVRIQMTNWEDLRRKTVAAREASIQSSSVLSILAKNIAASTNLLFGRPQTDRRDLRRSPREFLPWVAAYVANQDASVPASVRDISADGMFVVTSERWLLGNIVPVRLTDWRASSSERSILLNAMAVRWSEEGVGLRFIFQKPRRDLLATIGDARLLDVTKRQLKHFLKEFKAGKNLLA